MLGFRYMKTPPTVHVVHYAGGEVKREGAGLSFFYFAPTAMIVHVPLGSTGVPFVFNEATADFQDVTIQGELTYRITDAKRVAGLLDFSVDANGRYRSDDPSKLQERLVNVAQIIARSFTQQRPLGEVLIGSEALVQQMRDAVRESEVVQMLGVEVLGLSILSIKATPEMAKALQAEARETMLKKADEAVYVRRNAAIEQERAIKENELRTEIAVRQKQREVREAEMESEIAVAHKRREVRETQMAAEIAVEQQRTELVDQRVANERKEAEARAEALKATLEPMKDMDWRTLMALGGNGMDPKSIIAMAFRDLADNAEKVGNLSITPELLGSLLGEAGKARGGKGAK